MIKCECGHPSNRHTKKPFFDCGVKGCPCRMFRKKFKVKRNLALVLSSNLFERNLYTKSIRKGYKNPLKVRPLGKIQGDIRIKIEGAMETDR